jgi:hypothetical protein
VIALLRYQTAILLRSHRWILPVIGYGLLLATGAATGVTGRTQHGAPLAQGLDWSAAMLVPVVAFLTRSMLTAEPDAARACVAAAAGPVRSQLAALLTALGAGVVLGAGGAGFELLTNGGLTNGGLKQPAILLAGLVTAAVCLLVASAAGALMNPPLLRHPGASVLATMAAVIFALASNVSPAAAAMRDSGAPDSVQWPGITPLLTAVGLLAITWTASVRAAAKRDGRFPDTA